MIIPKADFGEPARSYMGMILFVSVLRKTGKVSPSVRIPGHSF